MLTYGKKSFGLTICLFILLLLHSTSRGFAYPVAFTDAAGRQIEVTERPRAVVSLVPSITEIILNIGADDALKGLTYHSSHLLGAADKFIVGGFSSPSIRRIESAEPDIIFLSDIHKEVRERFSRGKVPLIEFKNDSLIESFETILLLGRIFQRQGRATEIVEKIKRDLAHIEKKLSHVPPAERKRVLRLMGRNAMLVPGDDSFQNDMIRRAGGIPPALKRKGKVVEMTREEWLHFDPEIVYGCEANRGAARLFFNRPGWREVSAVKNGRIYWFPCDLTCRLSTHTGGFVSWLSSRIYSEAFSKRENQISEDRVTASRRLDLNLDYVKEAHIVESTIHDFKNKTLLIDFTEPLSVISTLEGKRDGIETIGNHFSSPPCWAITHHPGFTGMRDRVLAVLGKSGDRCSLLFTGADMDNLSLKRKTFKDMEVYALVTAGVRSNAVRMSADVGEFYEPGTINAMVLTNSRLTPRAMTRAVITATEAKTAALADLDIRSSYTALTNQATGTGTDNMIVVSGEGSPIELTGGHSKMGELIAGAVYEAVREAVYKQNGIVPGRDILQRLKERKIDLFDLISTEAFQNPIKGRNLVVSMEEILLDPRYAGFITAALTLSDDYERGLIQDTGAFESWCRAISEEIAGKKIEKSADLVTREHIPVLLRKALNALLKGLEAKRATTIPMGGAVRGNIDRTYLRNRQ
ncbi:MAG: adenosylcobinamide amidohydrolase [Pseudomonadota bacterium]